MDISFDPAKDVRNVALRGLSFARAADFDWDGADIIEDVRFVYTERRFVAVGYLDGRLHVLCFTPTVDGIRVISFRKANVREAKRYGKAQTID
jgi:uncharacterized DUF497 family protein